MSEGHGDIRTIRNIAIFFLVMFIIGLLLSIGSGVYIYYQAWKLKKETEEETEREEGAPKGSTMTSTAMAFKTAG